MLTLPLFASRKQEIDGTAPIPLDPGCSRCDLHRQGAKTVCMKAEGEPGGVLLVAEHPARQEDLLGRPLIGASGTYLRKLVKEWWSGPIAFDNAVRCSPGKAEVNSTAIGRCRPYLAGTIEEAAPDRIVALGGAAAQAILGRSIHVTSARRGYAWLSEPHPIPVFFTVNPAYALRNRFQRQWFEDDLHWILTCDPKRDAPPPPWDASCRVVRTPLESEAAAAELRAAGWFAYDVETAGRHHEPGFEILCLSACAVGSTSPIVWGDEALRIPAAREPLLRLLEDRRVGKVAQNGKFDGLSVREAWGIWVRPLLGDTMLSRALIDPESERNLELMAELVGHGGHKKEAHAAEKAAEEKLRDLLSREKRDAASGQQGLFGDTSQAPIPGLTPELSRLARSGARLATVCFKLISGPTLQRYNALDAMVTARLWEKFGAELDREKALQRVWTRSVRGAAEAVERVEHWGAPVSRDAVTDLIFFLQTQQREIQKRLDQYGENFNPNSPPQLAEVLFKKLGLKSTKLTGSGQPSTDAEVLEDLVGKHPIVHDILEHRRISKLLGTYANGLLKHIRSDGRIHPDWKIDGTKTGRWSCVAPWTLIQTSRGQKPIVEVRAGDLVRTHLGRWRRVVRLIPQGVQEVLDVQLSTGDILTCTADHRLLLEGGRWVTVQEIHERLEGLGERSAEPAGGFGAVPEPRPAEDGGHSGGSGDLVSQRPARGEDVHPGGGEDGAEGAPLLRLQDGHQEPDEGEDQGGTSPLERSVRGREGVPDLSVERGAAPHAPGGDDGGPGADGAPGGDGRSPHRRGPEAQRPGQPGAGHAGRPSGHPLAGAGQRVVEVEAIHPRGRLEVYDLTVEEDHSYETLGIFSHNCQDPNLQNIPKAEDDEDNPEAKLIKGCFVAAPGHLLLQADYRQIEYRVAAMRSGDPVLIDIFNRGEDMHLGTARIVAPFFKIDPKIVDKKHWLRHFSKTINFLMLYGGGDFAAAQKLGCKVEEAARVRTAIMGSFKVLDRTLKEMIHEAKSTGYAWTFLGEGERGRRSPLWRIAEQGDDDKARRARSNAEHAATNHPIQGSAAEFTTRSLAELVSIIVDEGLPARLVLTVHDSLVFEVPERHVDEVADTVVAVMTGWKTPHAVPIEVDLEVGKSWGSMEKYEGGRAAPAKSSSVSAQMGAPV